MNKTKNFFINTLKEKLWFKPMLFCIFSVAVAFLAHVVDGIGLNDVVPDIEQDFISSLLKTLSSVMLVISTFAVASMLTAFASATGATTARAFSILIKDDVSQLALSVFIGTFIFSVVGSIALATEYYAAAGKFALFVITIIFFAAVIFILLKWVDRISNLGRIGHTIRLVENAAAKAVTNFLKNPFMCGAPRTARNGNFNDIFSKNNGYVRHLDMEELQKIATNLSTTIQLNCRPGKYVHENFSLANITSDVSFITEEIRDKILGCIVIGDERYFENDPRFGIITLSEIASKALSPGINDPGTAIQIINAHGRIFFQWNKATGDREILFDRVELPALELKDMLEDAFRPIARDGANNIEVMMRLQKSLGYLKTIQNEEMRKYASLQSEEAYTRAESALTNHNDLNILKNEVRLVAETSKNL